MAINFSKSISTTEFLNAYNNNVVEFSSDNVLDSVKCTITIGGFPFVITPINNLFRFNFKEVIGVLINQNNHKDNIVPTSNIEVDNSLLGSWNVDYTITFSGIYYTVSASVARERPRICRSRYSWWDYYGIRRRLFYILGKN